VRKLLIYFLINLPLFLVACTYVLEEPSGTTREITPLQPSGTISLTDYIVEDTIYLYTNKIFTFDIKNDRSGPKFQGEAYFNNTLIYSFSIRQGQFSIPENYFKTGHYKLKISFIESLNDQSLITQFKDLQTTIFKEWVIIIDIDTPLNFEIGTSLDNGYVKYTWPKYEKPNFSRYELLISSGNGYKSLVVTDPSKNFIIDSTSIDGGAPSYLQVTIRNMFTYTTAYATVNEPPIDFNMVFHPEDTTARFVWSKPKYYGAFKSYTISDENTTLATVTAVKDTTINLKVDGVFPYVTRMSFKMLDKSETTIYQAEKNIDFFLGNATPTAAYGLFWYYSQSANKFIARTGPTINIYDDSFNLLTSRTIEDNAYYGMTVAWPGNFLHYIGTGHTISQLNLVNNSETSMSIAGDYISPTYLGVISGANNQVVSFYAIDNDHVRPPKDIVGLVNMQNTTVLHQENANQWTKISDDGRYSIEVQEVYSVSGGIETRIGTIPNNYYFRWFRGDNTDEIITTQYDDRVANELKTIIVRSNDMSILRTFDPPEAGFSLTAYDPATKTLLYTKFGATKVYLVNIDTGAKKIFKASGGYNTPLVNGTIIINGRYIKAI
jgi:hypothetical protein